MKTVVITGAGGGLGTLATQILRSTVMICYLYNLINLMSIIKNR